MHVLVVVSNLWPWLQVLAVVVVAVVVVIVVVLVAVVGLTVVVVVVVVAFLLVVVVGLALGSMHVSAMDHVSAFLQVLPAGQPASSKKIQNGGLGCVLLAL